MTEGGIGMFSVLMLDIWATSIFLYAIVSFAQFFVRRRGEFPSSDDLSGWAQLLPGIVAAMLYAPRICDLELAPIFLLNRVNALATLGIAMVVSVSLAVAQGFLIYRAIEFTRERWLGETSEAASCEELLDVPAPTKRAFHIGPYANALLIGMAEFLGFLLAILFSWGRSLLGRTLNKRLVYCFSRRSLQGQQARSIEKHLWGR